MEKRKLSFWQIWNMSFGFLGIQFGFALQGGYMSRIFQTLGAEPHDIPGLWIAAPLTGLIVQPIIGYLSDHTWSAKLGRRKPYFLLGAILSSFALFFVPYSSTLWIAAGFLWILDASINISMEPFRALVADKLPDEQRSYGFILQTLIIGIGTWVASNLPWLVKKLGFSETSDLNVIPENVKVAFGIGALVFLISILYTVLTTKEYPPSDLEAFKNKKKNTNFFSDIKEAYQSMTGTMLKLGIIQFFSWFAFFTMWSMATPALTEHVFKAPAPLQKDFDLADVAQKIKFDELNAAFQSASDSVGSAMGLYGLSSMAFALLLTFYSAKIKINRKYVHMFSLISGGLGFISMSFIPDPSYLNLSFILIGFSWGSILSMPYAMLSSSVDENKMGLMMGLFNMFIVIPQIIAALGGVNLLSKIFGSGAIAPMLLAGTSLVIAGLSNFLITDPKVIKG
ncbi:SLC45 family MFS transporter [Flavobacterium sp. CYK-4]|uniref:MFS transporter n=1 Tax=Flavobacterium lotistagni TaxID=2709660 RepID=UPI00140E68BE|nr:MFS transporter [Flavobacterium lotistagni]NHM06751.1 SLC45 family MFS transporter [Flavobacterium lotistagni]